MRLKPLVNKRVITKIKSKFLLFKSFIPKSIILKKKIFNGPSGAYIGLVNKCNFNCIFCPAHLNTKANIISSCRTETFSEDSYLNFRTFKKLLDDLSFLKTTSIGFQGLGEPFLHPDILEMVKLTKTRGNYLSITTNGSLISEAQAKALVDYSADSLGISLNSAVPSTHQRIHGITDDNLLERISATLKLIAEYKKAKKTNCPSVSISAVICKLNYREIKQLVDFAVSVNAQRLYFYRFYFCQGLKDNFTDTILTDEDFPVLKNELVLADFIATKNCIKTNICSFLKIYQNEFNKQSSYFRVKMHHMSKCGILADGAVYPVEFPEIMGNIKEKSLVDIWHSKNYLDFRRKILRLSIKEEHLPLNIFCRRCKDRPSYENKCKFHFVAVS